jgi:hypothetical protein
MSHTRIESAVEAIASVEPHKAQEHLCRFVIANGLKSCWTRTRPLGFSVAADRDD